jgi:hypothetical protein
LRIRGLLHVEGFIHCSDRDVWTDGAEEGDEAFDSRRAGEWLAGTEITALGHVFEFKPNLRSRKPCVRIGSRGEGKSLHLAQQPLSSLLVVEIKVSQCRRGVGECAEGRIIQKTCTLTQNLSARRAVH